MSAAKYAVLPTHFTHVIELADDKKLETSELIFKPIVGIVLDSFNIFDKCTSYYITNDGCKYSGDSKFIMLYDCIHSDVNYVFNVANYSYSDCKRTLILAHRNYARSMGGDV